jgi:hypothetical protein
MSPAVAAALKDLWGLDGDSKAWSLDQGPRHSRLSVQLRGKTIVCTKTRTDKRMRLVDKTLLFLTPDSRIDWRTGIYSSMYTRNTNGAEEMHSEPKELEKETAFNERKIRAVLKFYDFISE